MTKLFKKLSVIFITFQILFGLKTVPGSELICLFESVVTILFKFYFSDDKEHNNSGYFQNKRQLKSAFCTFWCKILVTYYRNKGNI